MDDADRLLTGHGLLVRPGGAPGRRIKVPIHPRERVVPLLVIEGQQLGVDRCHRCFCHAQQPRGSIELPSRSGNCC